MKLKTNHFQTIAGTHKIVKENGQEYTVRNNRDRFFFPDEWMAFYDSLKKGKKGKYSKQQIVFNTMINTGVRIFEGRNIKVKNIDFDRLNVVLTVTKKVVNKPGKETFGHSKIRVVKISKKFCKFLKQVIKQYDLQSEDSLPFLTTQAANICLKRNCKKVGIKDYEMFGTHNVRKSHEMWLMTQNVDSFKIVRQMGHSREISLKHYLIYADLFSFEEKEQIQGIIGRIY